MMYGNWKGRNKILAFIENIIANTGKQEESKENLRINK